MFSINQVNGESTDRAEVPLHSTMFSINPAYPDVPARAEHLYIPLCFLLIHRAVKVNLNVETPLHSTMFSINHDEQVNSPATGITLHSTMFSINHARTTIR